MSKSRQFTIDIENIRSALRYTTGVITRALGAMLPSIQEEVMNPLISEGKAHIMRFTPHMGYIVKGDSHIPVLAPLGCLDTDTGKLLEECSGEAVQVMRIASPTFALPQDDTEGLELINTDRADDRVVETLTAAMESIKDELIRLAESEGNPAHRLFVDTPRVRLKPIDDPRVVEFSLSVLAAQASSGFLDRH